MKVTTKDQLITMSEITVIEAEVLMIAVLNGAESRKSCEEPSRILRRLAMELDRAIPFDPTPITSAKSSQQTENNLFIKRLNKVN